MLFIQLMSALVLLVTNLKAETTKTQNDGELRVGGYFPANWDWRNENAVPRVKDMGSCHAGWAFAVTSMYQSYLMQATGTQYDLSEEYIIQCSDLGNCTSDPGHRNLRKTTNFAIEHGLPLEKDLPYQQYNISTGKVYIPNACETPTVKYMDLIRNHGSFASGYHNFRAVIKQSPSVSGLYATDSFWNYKSGTHSCSRDEQPIDINNFNHAVLIVGYNSDNNYIIQNSMGEDWGEYGYGIIDHKNDCGLSLINYQMFEFRGSVLLVLLIIQLISL